LAMVSKINRIFAQSAAVLALGLAFLVFFDALMRYLFHSGSIALQELEWHLFDLVFLLSAAYALNQERHVRVDLLFERFSPSTRDLIRFLDAALLVLPFGLLILFFGWEFAWQSFLQREASSDPGGLCCRYLIKGAIPLFGATLALEALAQMATLWKRIDGKKAVLAVVLAVGGVAAAAWSGEYFWIHPALLMFLAAFSLLMLGFRVAFVFGMVGVAFALMDWEVGIGVLSMLPMRIYGIMQNFTLMAVPLFILMGLILERSELARRLLEHIGALFGEMRGGLAVGVVVVGAVLGAATGIVGASVVMMSVITLPLMIRYGYDRALAAGTIAASGTLGQIIPPSIVLIVLGDVLSVSVGDLFKAAVAPGILLVLFYIVYVLLYAYLRPQAAPAIRLKRRPSPKEMAAAIVPALLLIVAVLGSIFAGIATPTESAAMGVVGALALAVFFRSVSWRTLRSVAMETALLSGMIFSILIGATAFSLVFNELGGEELVKSFFTLQVGDRESFVLVAMALVLLLGFFIDFVEISFVVIPLFVPLLGHFGIDPIWFGILVALNLQTSFLTPPFGFSLFYLKGAAKDLVSTRDIYKGVVPYILLQLAVLALVYFYPQIIRIW